MKTKDKDEPKLCGCGCGEFVTSRNPMAKYIHGHSPSARAMAKPKILKDILDEKEKEKEGKNKHVPKILTASDAELEKIIEDDAEDDHDGKDFDGEAVVAEEPAEEPDERLGAYDPAETKGQTEQDDSTTPKRDIRLEAMRALPNEFMPPEKPLDVKQIHEDMKVPDKKKEPLIFNPYVLVTGCVLLAALLQVWLFSTIVKIPDIGFVIIGIIDFIIWVALIIVVWRQRKLKQIIVFETVEQFIKEVPRWALTEKSPNAGIVGKFLKAGKRYKQIVLVSKHYEPRMLWSEWDGLMFIIDNRGYFPPRDIRGDVFFWDVDKSCPLVDSAKATEEDAENTFHLGAVRNEAFELGRIAAMGEVWGQIKMILILCICNLALLLLIGIFLYSQIGAINDQVTGISGEVRRFIANQTAMMQP